MKVAKKSAKVYDLIELSVINCWDQSTDIRRIFQTFTINESIFKQGTSGSVSVTDELGLFESLPFVGDEYLRISYRTDDDYIYDRVFRINRVDNGKQYSGKTRSYIIHFISQEIEMNQGVIVSKSYSQKTSDLIVNDIWSTLNASSELEIEESETAPRYVVPSLNPFNAISWLSRNSTSTFGYSDYVLYEDRVGWQWRTIRSMLDDDVIQTVNYNISDVPGLDKMTKNNIERIEYNRLYDTVEMYKTGLYGIKETQYSLIDKVITSESSSQDDPLYVDQPRISGKEVKSWDTPGGTGYHSVTSNDPETVYSGSHKAFMVRQQVMSEWYGNTMTLTLAGNSYHTCGKMIILNLPSMKAGHNRELDEYYSGEYLVTDASHSFTPDEYTVDLTVRSNVVREG